MRALTFRGWGSPGALLVLIAVVVTAAMTTVGTRAATPLADDSAAASASDVGRCRYLGQASEADPSCLQWRQSRARVLGLPPSGARP
jgi:conjugative transfer region protein TrbK